MQNDIVCPRCKSTQITANKKGFSGKKAVIGGLLTGGIGILAGTLGSNKIKITCLNCGMIFKPGEGGVYLDKSQFQVLNNDNKFKTVNEILLESKNSNSNLEINSTNSKLTFQEWSKQNPNKSLNEYYQEIKSKN